MNVGGVSVVSWEWGFLFILILSVVMRLVDLFLLVISYFLHFAHL